DYGIQRRHDSERSDEIKRYLLGGYPWSTLSARDREGRFSSLRMPGWLPTAIVTNVLGPDDQRNGQKVDESDLVAIVESKGEYRLALPKGCDKEGWSPSSLPPIEVIDGQHRLWAFDGLDEENDFDLPVVVFGGRGLGWQAYLF